MAISIQRQTGRLLAGRAMQAVTVAGLVGVLSFALVRMLPGDMALRIAASRYGPDLLSGTAADDVRAELGLTSPRPPTGRLAWPSRPFRLGKLAGLGAAGHR